MVSRHTRLRIRRKIRTHQQKVTGISDNANKQLDRHIFRRWENLKTSWRFVAAWLGLVILLVGAVLFQTRTLGNFYLDIQPTSGGIYSEGVVGEFTNSNPLYASNAVDLAVSRLIFAPLFTYDSNNQLVGDLASSIEPDARLTTYTVKLKPDLYWQDGLPLTTDDVLYTYQTIQNPDAQSPLLSSWRGISVEKLDDTTLRFVLPNPYSPFPYSLTNGIVPKHILQDIPIEQLRSASFNTSHPIGAGPFKWRDISTVIGAKNDQRSVIELVRYDNYNRGKPKLDGITLRTYADDEKLKTAITNKEVSSAAGLSMTDKEIGTSFLSTRFTLMSANMLFLNNSRSILNDVKVRQALTKATDVSALNTTTGYTVTPVLEPLLRGQIGYNVAYRQFGFNKDEAAALLDQVGWQLAGGEYRQKAGQELTLNLVYENSPEFSRLVALLQKQWADVGVHLTAESVEKGKQTRELTYNHDYDVLLYGINIGPDPDVYVYWHSSQIDKKLPIRLNLSEYSSAIADTALEGGRTRRDTALRAAKYQPFLEAWRNDAPAIGLYQPRYLVIANEQVYGREPRIINTPADRFDDAYLWMVNTSRVKKS